MAHDHFASFKEIGKPKIDCLAENEAIEAAFNFYNNFPEIKR